MSVLEEWRRRATPLEVSLRNGTTRGTLITFDRFMIALLTHEGLWAIYKHAILTIGPVAVLPNVEEAAKRRTLHLKRRADSQGRSRQITVRLHTQQPEAAGPEREDGEDR